MGYYAGCRAGSPGFGTCVRGIASHWCGDSNCVAFLFECPRADLTFWDSRNVHGLPQEKDELDRAAADYRRALDLYQNVAPYANASVGIVRVEASLLVVNARLQQIEDSGGTAQK